MPLTGLKIGSLGGGAMAEALFAGLVKSGFPPADLYASDVEQKRLAYLQKKLGISAVQNNCRLVETVDIVVLAVKPQIVGQVLPETGGLFRSGQTLISIAAGVPIKYIEGFLKHPVGVVRVMPNTPCLVGAGASALCAGTHAREEDLRRARAIFSAVGRVAEVPERLMDAVTGLSGSGPAYMFMILDALIDAGLRVGLPRETAFFLSAQTMLGAAKMALENGEHPARLKNLVTTPAGTAIEGIFALEEGGLRPTLMKAVSAATRRSSEISAGLK
ncbi:MAG: pyrroline-5-carboxylate reductase [Bacillota bacterium]